MEPLLSEESGKGAEIYCVYLVPDAVRVVPHGVPVVLNPLAEGELPGTCKSAPSVADDLLLTPTFSFQHIQVNVRARKFMLASVLISCFSSAAMTLFSVWQMTDFHITTKDGTLCFTYHPPPGT
jgi:hypothetical protein